MLYLSAEDWARTQTIGITGGSGMMGQVLVRQLVDLGVRSIRILDTKGEGKRAGRIQHPSVNYVSGSILEETDLQHALRNCSTVLHFAGIKHVRRAQREPVTTIQVNSMGTGLVADACRRLGVEKLVYASSGLVYGVPLHPTLSEDHPTHPKTIYAASKLAGEAIVSGYAAGFGLSATIVRYGNIYGPQCGAGTVVGRAIEQAAAREDINLADHGPVRDFIYVEDAIAATIRLALLPNVPFGVRVVNVGRGEGFSVGEIAVLMSEAARAEGLGPVGVHPPETGVEERSDSLVLNTRLLETITGWAPGTSLKEGLALSLKERLRGRFVVP